MTCGHTNQTELDCSPLPPGLNRVVSKQPADVGSVSSLTIHFCRGYNHRPHVDGNSRDLPPFAFGRGRKVVSIPLAPLNVSSPQRFHLHHHNPMMDPKLPHILPFIERGTPIPRLQPQLVNIVESFSARTPRPFPR